jgi:PhnB protein
VKTNLNPYINFRGTTREAMTFYQSVLGGKLSISTFKDYHAAEDPSEEDLIMHSMLVTENGIVIMAADAPDRMDLHFGDNISLMLGGDNLEELTDYFNKLSHKGTVFQSLKKEMWGDTFGMFVDQFGIQWMVNISSSPA